MLVRKQHRLAALGLVTLGCAPALGGDVPCIFPVLEGSYDTNGSARASAIAGDYAYIADGASGVTALLISDLTNPALADSYDTAGNGLDLRLVGDRLYLADDTAGLVVFDVSSPGTLTPIGSFDTAGRAFGIDVAGTTVYIADRENGLLVLDASNPASITQLGQYTIGSTEFVLDVVVDGTTAYLAGNNGGAFEIVDVSNPGLIVKLGGIPTLSSGISIDHNAGTVCYAQSSTGLTTIDVTDPANPVALQTTALASPRSVTMDGALAFVGNNNNGLSIIDVSDPAAHIVLGSYDTPGNAYGVGVSGSVACIGDFFSGVQFVDLNASDCKADLTGDCVLDFFDVSLFLTLLGDRDPIADFDANGAFDFFDLSAFLSAFGEGCP